MAKKNGKALRIIAIIVSALLVAAITAGGVIFAYGGKMHAVEDNTEDIAGMEPKVESNTQKYLVIERDIYWMQQDIADIHSDNVEIKAGINKLLEK